MIERRKDQLARCNVGALHGYACGVQCNRPCYALPRQQKRPCAVPSARTTDERRGLLRRTFISCTSVIISFIFADLACGTCLPRGLWARIKPHGTRARQQAIPS